MSRLTLVLLLGCAVLVHSDIQNAHITLIGDSITFYTPGFVAYLEAANPTSTFTKYALPGAQAKNVADGWPSRGWYQRYEDYLQHDVCGNVVVIYIGVNDIIYNHYTMEQTTSFIRRMIQSTRNAGRLVVVATPALLRGKEDKVELYREAIIEMASKFDGCAIADLTTVFKENQKKNISIDGVHPNVLGNQIVSMAIEEAISQVLSSHQPFLQIVEPDSAFQQPGRDVRVKWAKTNDDKYEPYLLKLTITSQGKSIERSMHPNETQTEVALSPGVSQIRIGAILSEKRPIAPSACSYVYVKEHTASRSDWSSSAVRVVSLIHSGNVDDLVAKLASVDIDLTFVIINKDVQRLECNPRQHQCIETPVCQKSFPRPRFFAREPALYYWRSWAILCELESLENDDVVVFLELSDRVLASADAIVHLVVEARNSEKGVALFKENFMFYNDFMYAALDMMVYRAGVTRDETQEKLDFLLSYSSLNSTERMMCENKGWDIVSHRTIAVQKRGIKFVEEWVSVLARTIRAIWDKDDEIEATGEEVELFQNGHGVDGAALTALATRWNISVLRDVSADGLFDACSKGVFPQLFYQI